MIKKFISYFLITALLALCVPCAVSAEEEESSAAQIAEDATDTEGETASAPDDGTDAFAETGTEAESVTEDASESGEIPPFPYDDVFEDAWYYSAVSGLYYNLIAPENEHFYPDNRDLRGNYVYFIYMLSLALGGEPYENADAPFTDVGEDMYYYTAVAWAAENKIISGVGEGYFLPESEITKEEACLVLARFAEKFGLKLSAAGNTEQFYDSLKVTSYARSAVSACKLAGLINADEKNRFYPQKSITRAESASLLYNFLQSVKNEAGEEKVNTADGAYDYLYDSYVTPFTPLVPESEAVDLSYFDDAVFIGDSVTVSLQYYCASSGALGGAQFLASTSLSQVNAMSEVTRSSFHPSFRGQKMRVEDAVAACGAKKVYIMLGINCLRSGAEYCADALEKLVDKIKEKSPDAVIIIESTTPMTDTSNIKAANLNNNIINDYNARLLEICGKRGWYFVNVSEAVKNSSGALTASYCSDKNGMGIHFNNTGDEIWVNYLKTHVPEELK